MKLLHIDSSISGGQSVSRQLTASIVARLKQITPGLEITYRDLAIAPVPHQSPTILFAKMKALYEAGALAGHIVETVAAAVQGGAKVDASTQAAFAETNVVLDEFLAADIIVLGAPMYNFGIPSQLNSSWTLRCGAAIDEASHFNYLSCAWPKFRLICGATSLPSGGQFTLVIAINCGKLRCLESVPHVLPHQTIR